MRRVLEIAVDEGHEDPRHRDHWWPWKEWPLDGRQYWLANEDEKIDKTAVSEHKNRSKMEGALQTKLLVERKMEGIIWDPDKPRLVLRATGAFDADI